VGRRPLTVSKHAGKVEDAPLAGGEQLLAREFGRGVEIACRPGEVAADELGRKTVEMRFIARRDLEAGRLNLDEVALLEEAPERSLQAVAAEKKGPAPLMDAGIPPAGVIV
jgi:hypothetical protein